MIFCEIVGNVSFVIVNVSPTLITKGVHEVRKSLSLVPKRLPFVKNGILEKSFDDSTTLAANSRACFKVKKLIPPRPRARTANNCSSVFRRMARNNAKRITISDAIKTVGINN